MLKGMGRHPTIVDGYRIDFTDRVVDMDMVAINNSVPGQKTIAKLEAAANAWLAQRADPGDVWRIHVYSLTPMSFAVFHSFNGYVPSETAQNHWWPDE